MFVGNIGTSFSGKNGVADVVFSAEFVELIGLRERASMTANIKKSRKIEVMTPKIIFVFLSEMVIFLEFTKSLLNEKQGFCSKF